MVLGSVVENRCDMQSFPYFLKMVSGIDVPKANARTSRLGSIGMGKTRCRVGKMTEPGMDAGIKRLD